MFGVPINDDSREKIKPSQSVVLAYTGSIPNLTLSSNPQRIFKCMMRFPFVEAELSASLQICIEQPLHIE